MLLQAQFRKKIFIVSLFLLKSQKHQPLSYWNYTGLSIGNIRVALNSINSYCNNQLIL